MMHEDKVRLDVRYCPKWLLRWLIGQDKCALLRRGHSVSAEIVFLDIGFIRIAVEAVVTPDMI